MHFRTHLSTLKCLKIIEEDCYKIWKKVDIHFSLSHDPQNGSSSTCHIGDKRDLLQYVMRRDEYEFLARVKRRGLHRNVFYTSNSHFTSDGKCRMGLFGKFFAYFANYHVLGLLELIYSYICKGDLVSACGLNIILSHTLRSFKVLRNHWTTTLQSFLKNCRLLFKILGRPKRLLVQYVMTQA